MVVTLTTLTSFDGSDGKWPYADLIADTVGNLFGTTLQGGAYGDGAVFEIAKTAGGYESTSTTIISFDGKDGDYPNGSLTTDAAGNLFGTTSSGGADGKGGVFEIAKTANGFASAPTTLVSFNGSDGEYPASGLIADAAGDLFGTTQEGGAFNTLAPGEPDGDGTVFEIAKTPSGYASTPVTLVSFNGSDGEYPASGLIADAAGDLFGTTGAGGASGPGTVFEIAKTPNGYASAPTTLVSFNGSDGSAPASGLIADAAGDLFGTTEAGGAFSDGAVFEIEKTADGYASTPTTLVSFDGKDGEQPSSNLIADAAGNIFGTTTAGGANGYNAIAGDGTVFEITKTATGYASEPTTLVNFDVEDGEYPYSGLIVDTTGDLFGTTFEGGGDDVGSVYELSGVGFQTAISTSQGPTTYDWLKPVDGNFDTAADWSPYGGPQVSASGGGPAVSVDTALFATGSDQPYVISGYGQAQTYKISGDRVTFDRFSGGQPGASLYVEDHASLTLAATSRFDSVADDGGAGGSVFIDSGLLAVHGSMDVGPIEVGASGVLKVNGGTLSTSTGSTLVVAHGGQVEVVGGATLSDASLALDGDLVVSGIGSTANFVGFLGGYDLSALNADGDVTVSHGGEFSVDARLLGKLAIAAGPASIGSIGAGGFAGGSGSLALILDPALSPNGHTNDGTISATDGVLHVTGTIAGTGALYADAGATLDLGASTAETINFKGSDAALMLDKGISASGLLKGFVAGDSIDLAGSNVTSLDFSYVGNTTLITAHASGLPDNTLDIQGHLAASMLRVRQEISALSFAVPDRIV